LTAAWLSATFAKESKVASLDELAKVKSLLATGLSSKAWKNVWSFKGMLGCYQKDVAKSIFNTIFSVFCFLLSEINSPNTCPGLGCLP